MRNSRLSQVKFKILKFNDESEDLSPKILRVAIYARYSSVGNSPYSAEEQVMRIRHRLDSGMIRSKRFPNAKLVIDENWVVKDEAKTGRVGREGLELVKSGVRDKAFDILVTDDLSRLARELGGFLDLYDILVFSQTEALSVSDNISTVDDNSRDLFVFKGYANEHQSKATSKNTIRGLEMRVLNGFSTGHNPYGYTSVPTKTASIKGMEKPSHYDIKIDYEKAEVVRRIWSLYADGLGFRAICTVLNKEGISTPGKRGRGTSNRWCENTVGNMLRQEKYLGVWKYRQSKVVRNPHTDKLAQVPRPHSEWLVSEREDLRIISPDLAERVKKRQLEMEAERKDAVTSEQKIFGTRGKSPNHLFTGIPYCGLCGANFILVSGKDGGYIGCNNANRQTSQHCENKQMVRVSDVESAMISELRQHLDNPEIHAQVASRYNKLMSKQYGEAPKRLFEVEQQIQETQKAISNYDRFIKSGTWSDTIVANLSEAEKTLKRLRVERDHLKSQIGDRVYITPAVIRDRMMKLDEILAEKVIQANSMLRKIFAKGVKMIPQGSGRKGKYYDASGVIALSPKSSDDELMQIPFSIQINRKQKN